MPRKVRFPVSGASGPRSRQPSGLGQRRARVTASAAKRIEAGPIDGRLREAEVDRAGRRARDGGHRRPGAGGRWRGRAARARGALVARRRGGRADEVVGRVLARDARGVELQADRARLAAALAQVGRRPRLLHRDLAAQAAVGAAPERGADDVELAAAVACAGSLKNAGLGVWAAAGAARAPASTSSATSRRIAQPVRSAAAAAISSRSPGAGCHGSRSGSVS